MKLASIERAGVDPGRLLAVAFVLGGLSSAVLQLVSGDVMGSGAPELDLVVGIIVFYIVVSTPRRTTEASSLSQSREAPTIAVMASATLEATHSRSRTIMMLRPSDKGYSEALRDAKRKILLGHPVGASVEGCARALPSTSAGEVLRKTAVLGPESIEEGGEESRGIMGSLQLAEESKVPIFTTVCFFTPIMLLLYAMFSHIADPRSLAELVGLQFVLLDVAFYFSSPERRRLG